MLETSQAAMWGQPMSQANYSVHTKTLTSVHPSEHDGAVRGVYQSGYGGAAAGYPGCTGWVRWWVARVHQDGYSIQYLVSGHSTQAHSTSIQATVPRPTVPRPQATVPRPRLQHLGS